MEKAALARPAVTPPAAAPPVAFVEQTATVTPIAEGKKGKKRGKNKPEPEPLPEPVHPGSYSLEQLRDVDAEHVRLVTDQMDDAMLFGSLLLPYVQKLRETMPAPEAVADAVLQAQGQIQGFGGAVPPAMDLLTVGQLEVLVERLFPDAPEGYRDAVVAAIGEAEEAELEEDEEEPA